MSAALDMTGEVYGRLTVIEPADTEVGGCLRWLCRCACGGTHTVRGSNLRRGAIKSCGCLRAEVQRTRARMRNTKVTP